MIFVPGAVWQTINALQTVRVGGKATSEQMVVFCHCLS